MNIREQMKHQYNYCLAGVLWLILTACGGSSNPTSTPPGTQAASKTDFSLSNNVLVDGATAVFAISKAMAPKFMKANPGVKVTIGSSGTGEGFKNFCVGETDISNATRPIDQSEIKLCQENGIEYIEIPVAFDGIAVIVNPANNWATCLTPEELEKMWAEDNIVNWKQVRNGYPDRVLSIYAPDTNSGIDEYLTQLHEATIDRQGKSRTNYNATGFDDIVQGVLSNQNGIGFLSFGYYQEKKDILKVIAIKTAKGECVQPTEKTITDGTYNLLARPLFFYVNKAAYEENPSVKAFAEYQIDAVNSSLISKVGYIPLPDNLLLKVQARLKNVTTGSMFQGGSSLGVRLADKL